MPKLFNSLPPQTCFQEVPDEIALAFTITGCPLACPGCHSQDTWDAQKGQPLTAARFDHYLHQYQSMVTCVLFFGGEWYCSLLSERLKQAQQAGLKTCLYTGLERLPYSLKPHLDFVKLGPWRPELGGLSSPGTNQRFIDLATGNQLNHKFWEHYHDVA